MKKEIIIYQPWGGLGDNLSHSSIPEICNDLNIDCYLSNQNVCRNQEIYDFVWGKNPYIKGKRDSTDMSWLDQPIQQQNNRDWNEMRNNQSRYGLDSQCHYPKIYYQPKLIPELTDSSIFDLSTFSFYNYYYDPTIPFNINNINNCIQHIIEKYNMENITNIVHSATYTKTPRPPILNTTEKYNINTLEHYCDVMFSCKNYISVTSGQSVLASTVKNTYKTNCNIVMLSLERFTPPTNYQFLHFKNTNYATLDTQRILESIE